MCLCTDEGEKWLDESEGDGRKEGMSGVEVIRTTVAGGKARVR